MYYVPNAEEWNEWELLNKLLFIFNHHKLSAVQRLIIYFEIIRRALSFPMQNHNVFRLKQIIHIA
jgi:hypothetical protein